MSGQTIELSFGMCEVCGAKNGRPGHDCDNGEALRKAARELFAPTVDLIEKTIAKAGTGVLRGVFEVAFERDRLLSQNAKLREALECAPIWLRAYIEMRNISIGDEVLCRAALAHISAALAEPQL